MITIAGMVVICSGLFLVGLAVSIMVIPKRAEVFLNSFASSARAHYIEQGLRLISGAAFIVFAPQMQYSTVFRVYGWVLALTAAGLFLIPWRWHQRFAEWVIPLAIKYMKLFALGAFALGVFILYAAF